MSETNETNDASETSEAGERTKGTVLVTGGSGLIGRAVTGELTGAGWEVVVLSRSPEKVSGLPAGARTARWDGETAEGWWELADGAAGIVHLAGEGIGDGPWTAEKKRRIRESRVRSSGAVLEAVRRADHPPRFLLQASGIDYYGDTGDRVATEEDPPGEGFLPDLAVEWESVTRPVEDLGVRRALLRSAMVLSREGGALPKLALPFKLFVGGPVGSGDQWVAWIHRADEAGAIRFLAARAEASGPFNLTAPNPVTNRELSREVARALGRPSLFRAPAIALHAALGEMADMLLGSRRALPAKLERLGYRFRFPTLREALADLYG